LRPPATLAVIGAVLLGACTAVIGLPDVPGEGDGGRGPDGTVTVAPDGGGDGRGPARDGGRPDGTLRSEAGPDGARDGTSNQPDAASPEASTACSDASCQGACIDAGCLEVFATGQSEPYAVTTAGGSVFWTNMGAGGSVVRADVAGGALVTLDLNASEPEAVAVSAGYVYWTGGSNHRVWRAPVDGAAGSGSIFDQGEGVAEPDGLALANGVLYWTDQVQSAVNVVPLDGGTKTTLSSPPESLPAEVVVAAGSVYWTGQGANSGLYMQSVDASVPTFIDPHATGSFGIAADSERVYWTIDSSPQGFVCSVPLGGGLITTLAEFPGPFELAVADGSIYVTVQGAAGADAGPNVGMVVRLATTGGSPVTLAEGQQAPTGIAFDGNKSLYWANNGSGRIMRLTLQ
jgi:sugar lactone lactonase YvrE